MMRILLPIFLNVMQFDICFSNKGLYMFEKVHKKKTKGVSKHILYTSLNSKTLTLRFVNATQIKILNT